MTHTRRGRSRGQLGSAGRGGARGIAQYGQETEGRGGQVNLQFNNGIEDEWRAVRAGNRESA